MNARTLIALLLAAAATGCVDNNASVRISAACFPPTPNDDGSCSYPSTCDSVMLDNLWVDPSYAPTGGTLVWPFQVDNQRPDNATSDGADQHRHRLHHRLQDRLLLQRGLHPGRLSHRGHHAHRRAGGHPGPLHPGRPA